MSSVVKMSLSASGTPASGPSCSPARGACVDGAGLRERGLARRRAGRRATFGSTSAMRSRCAWVDLDGGDLAGGDQRGRARRRSGDQSLMPPPPGSAAPGSGRPRRRARRTAPARGVEAGPHLVGTEDVGQRQRVRGRRYVFGGDLGDAGDRADDLVELAGEVVQLFVGQLQPGQPGEVSDLLAGYGGHESSNPFRGCEMWTGLHPRARPTSRTIPHAHARTARPHRHAAADALGRGHTAPAAASPR